MKLAMKAAPVLAAVIALLAVTACGVPAAPPPPHPRARTAIGQEWAPAVSYLNAHPVRPGKNMLAGIIVQAGSKGYVCMGWCHTWHARVVLAGGWEEKLHSGQGDNGMSALAQPGDYIRFPAGGQVDAPSDDMGGLTASVITAGAVAP